MDHTGDLQACCCAHDRHADEAALGEDDIRAITLEELPCLGIALQHTEWIREIFDVKIAAQLPCGNADIGNAAVAHQFLLYAVFRADIGYLISCLPEGGQKRDVGRHMPCSAASSEDNLFLSCICHFIHLMKK